MGIHKTRLGFFPVIQTPTWTMMTEHNSPRRYPMKHGSLGFVVVFTVVAALWALPAAGQAAQAQSSEWTVPHTPDGRPDLQGVWANNNITPLERPTELSNRAYLTGEELGRLKANANQLFGGEGDAAFGDDIFLAAISETTEFTSTDGGTGNYNQFWLVERDVNDRTSLVIDPPDGRIPALTPSAEQTQSQRAAYGEAHPADGPEDRRLGERCVNFGVPKLFAGYNSYRQIVQTPGHVAISHEMAHDVRLIPLDGRPHIGDSTRQWNGDPRGHWEGDTLVVETTNFSSKSDFYLSGPVEDLHLVERFTRVGPDTLEYEATITDRKTWTRPWTVLIPLKRSDAAIFEYTCHEGNYGMEGILAGHRAQEKASAAQRSQGK